MVEWLAGNRIRGTSAEKPVASLQSPSVGGWVELGRTTLGSANADITVTGLADKRYYKVLTDVAGKSANFDVGVRFNADSGSNYARRFSTNGGTDISTGSLSAAMWVSTAASATTPEFGVHYISNVNTKEKLFLGHSVRQYTAGAGTAPDRGELTGKHAQTTNPISSITVTSAGASTFDTGSEVVVLGWDPTDTHTTNFWEELGTATITSAGQLDTGAFSAKKYLWVQYNCNSTDGGFGFRFNSDTATNYARRFSQNGATDQTELNYNMMRMIWSAANTYYGNMFIINNSANEKLVINHQAGITATGAGTAPYRWETAGKWITTGSQITSIQFLDHADASGYIDDGTVTVWGSD